VVGVARRWVAGEEVRAKAGELAGEDAQVEEQWG
jgi:hypothetical protein